MAETPVAIAIQPVVAVEKLLVVIVFSPDLLETDLTMCQKGKYLLQNRFTLFR